MIKDIDIKDKQGADMNPNKKTIQGLVDKNGSEIKAGDTLFNPHDREQYHTVLQGADGKLYLGDFDSPLERYAPQTWWEKTGYRDCPGPD